VVLTAGEMNPDDDITQVLFHDAAGAEWQDYSVTLMPTASTLEVIYAYLVAQFAAVTAIVNAIAANVLLILVDTAALIIAVAANLVAINAVPAAVKSLLLNVAPIKRYLRSGDLELYRGDTWEQPILRLGDISTKTELWITCKEDEDDLDASAVFKIEETIGLQVIDGAVATVPGNATITVADPTVGNIIVTLAAVETAKLSDSGKPKYYDVQWADAAGVVTTPRKGRLAVVADLTRET